MSLAPDGPVAASRLGLWMRSLLGGVLLSNYLRLIALTSRLKLRPEGQWQTVDENWPVIFVSWHGQSNLAYVYTPRRREWSILECLALDTGRVVRKERLLSNERAGCYSALARWWFVNWNIARAAVDVLAVVAPGLPIAAERLKIRMFGAAPGHLLADRKQ